MLQFSPSVSSMFIQYKPSKTMKPKRKKSKTSLKQSSSNLQKQLFFILFKKKQAILTSQCLISSIYETLRPSCPSNQEVKYSSCCATATSELSSKVGRSHFRKWGGRSLTWEADTDITCVSPLRATLFIEEFNILKYLTCTEIK